MKIRCYELGTKTARQTLLDNWCLNKMNTYTANKPSLKGRVELGSCDAQDENVDSIVKKLKILPLSNVTDTRKERL